MASRIHLGLRLGIEILQTWQNVLFLLLYFSFSTLLWSDIYFHTFLTWFLLLAYGHISVLLVDRKKAKEDNSAGVCFKFYVFKGAED